MKKNTSTVKNKIHHAYFLHFTQKRFIFAVVGIIIKVGINFSSKEKNITDWKVAE